MKLKAFCMAVFASAVVAAPAHALFIDLEGVIADGAGLNQGVFNNPDTNAVIDVTFNFIYQAGDCAVCGDPAGSGNPSWGSELILEVFHVDTGTAGQIGTQDQSCDAFGLICEVDLGWDDDPGIFNASGSFAFASPIADGSGDWVVTVADSFDDAGIDGVFLAGSYVSINQATPSVPVPATLLLIGAGLVGFGLARRLS